MVGMHHVHPVRFGIARHDVDAGLADQLVRSDAAANGAAHRRAIRASF